MKRIICVGNRYSPEDAAGPMVFDRLVQGSIPPEVEVVDGGLAGLDLLRFVDDTECVVFVDAVSGFLSSDGVVVLNADEAARHAPTSYDHSAGLGYLLRILPEVCEGILPEIVLVGIEGTPTPEAIAQAAELSLTIAGAIPDGVNRADETIRS